MPLTLFIALLTLAPAFCALGIVGIGYAPRASAALIAGLAALGILIPIICLIILAPALAAPDPIQLTLFGGAACSGVCFSPAYRLDAFSLYAALGVAFLVTPLLLWLAWARSLVPASSQASVDTAESADATDDQDASEVPGDDHQQASPLVANGAFARRELTPPVWGGVALALGVETVTLTLLFADNILWLGLCWLILAALVWTLGEIGNPLETIDRSGLIFSLLGPALWTIAMLIIASAAHVSRLIDLIGRGGAAVWQIIFLALTLALAGGAYPFTVWVRRRAALVTPAGLAAVILALLPITLFVGARSYSALQDTSNLWPQIGQAHPPITAGIAFIALGAITIVLTGMLALGRRDGRSLIAFAAVAQVGWGLLALGVGAPVSLLGLTVLLATSVCGLGAMIAALFAGGVLAADIELDGAGPRAFGSPLRPALLAAWGIGAASLVGAPLFAGFVSRQLISAAALSSGGLVIPLVGISWAGDALLALAILRATAPALTRSGLALASSSVIAEDEAPFVVAPLADGASPDDESDTEGDIEDEDAESPYGSFTDHGQGARGTRDLREVPALILAALALLLGIAPQLLFLFGGKLASATLVQAGALDSAASVAQLGYTAGVGQWLPSLGWLVLVVLALVAFALRPDTPRVERPLTLIPVAAPTSHNDENAELSALPEPTDAWRDLQGVFTSAITLPGSQSLLVGTEDEVSAFEDDPADEADALEPGANDEPIVAESSVESHRASPQKTEDVATMPIAETQAKTVGHVVNEDAPGPFSAQQLTTEDVVSSTTAATANAAQRAKPSAVAIVSTKNVSGSVAQPRPNANTSGNAKSGSSKNRSGKSRKNGNRGAKGGRA